MRIEAIYITYNTYTLLAYSSNFNYCYIFEALRARFAIFKNYWDLNKYLYKPRNIKLSTLLSIAIMRNDLEYVISRIKVDNILSRKLFKSFNSEIKFEVILINVFLKSFRRDQDPEF